MNDSLLNFLRGFGEPCSVDRLWGELLALRRYGPNAWDDLPACHADMQRQLEALEHAGVVEQREQGWWFKQRKPERVLFG